LQIEKPDLGIVPDIDVAMWDLTYVMGGKEAENGLGRLAEEG
jgi:hypothetical protein